MAIHLRCIVAMVVVGTTVLSAYPGGVAGRTLKSTSTGCGSCHGSASSASVVVTISGPDSLRNGELGQYQVDVKDISGTKGGINIAASNGNLAPASPYLKALSGELVHNARAPVPYSYQFTFTAPSSGGTITLYAIAKGSAMNSWNWAPNKIVKVIVIAPVAPTLLSPAQGAVGQPINLSMQWNATIGVTGCELQGSKDAGFTSVAFGDSALTGLSYQTLDLALNTEYFWRVRAKNSAGISPWSETRNFKTIPQIPDPVALFLPVDRAAISADSAMLIWRKPQPEASRYWVQVGTDSVFKDAVNDSSITDSTTVVRGLSANVSYWWRVRAWNLAGWGDFGSKRSFAVTTSGVLDFASNPDNYLLYQNYPNPFNPTTNVTFALPSSAYLSLKVYDVLGREVAVLAHGVMSPGHHTIQWNAARFPSGVYIYIMSSASISKSGKMLLAK